VAGGVHDVDAGVLPDDRGRLGQDGDAALFFEVVRIHHALGDALVLAERARLLQELVDEGGLAMVDVGDDGDVAQLHRLNPSKKTRLDPGRVLSRTQPLQDRAGWEICCSAI
jgi:hypothetical protein